MAEAMIPPELRPQILSESRRRTNPPDPPNPSNPNPSSSLHVISSSFHSNSSISEEEGGHSNKRTKQNVVTIALPADIKRPKMTHITEGHEVRRILEGTIECLFCLFLSIMVITSY